MWGISSRLLQQSAATAPYLEQVAPPDLEHGVAPLKPLVPTQLPLLGCGVAPLGRHPWPWTWASSSQQLLSRRGLALLVAAPDLGCGVAPLRGTSAWSIAAAALLCMCFSCFISVSELLIR